MVQNGTARFSSARFVFPLQFSTLEWAGLFTCRYICATSTAVTPEILFNSIKLSLDPLIERLYFLKRQRYSHFLLVKKDALIQNSCV